MGKTTTSLLMVLLGLLVAFAVGRWVVSMVRLVRNPIAERRQVSAVWKLSTGVLTALGALVIVLGYLYRNTFYMLLGAYLVFTAAHYYTVRRLP